MWAVYPPPRAAMPSRAPSDEATAARRRPTRSTARLAGWWAGSRVPARAASVLIWAKVDSPSWRSISVVTRMACMRGVNGISWREAYQTTDPPATAAPVAYARNLRLDGESGVREGPPPRPPPPPPRPPKRE